jgi:DNA ligase (NAD+)
MSVSKNTKEFLTKLSNKSFNLQEFIDDIDAKKLEKILRDLSLAYYNEGESLVTDEIFDFLKEQLEDKDPNNQFLNEVGAPIDSKDKVKLPFPMGSLDKIKPSSQELDKWKKDYKGPYVVSDKLDGISAQLYIDKSGKAKLYTRGDGEYGQDISHLIPYVTNIDDILDYDNIISIRGELIISKNNFLKVKDKFKNARNAVAGFVNSKKVDKSLSKLVEFIGYTVITPPMKQDDQMIYLEEFEPIEKVVHYKIYKSDKLTNENLSKYLEERRKSSKYEVDGIVVFDSSRTYDHSSGNPDNGFAFKAIMSDQYAEAMVVDIIWEASMDGFLKPKVQINPINLVGVTITYATAFHAKFVEENKLGPGAIIKIIRSGDVIPHIMEVIKPAIAKMPDTEYIWDKNHVNIMVKNLNKSKYLNVIKAKKMDYFFSVLGVKNISIGILNKLVEEGFDNIIKILDADRDDLADIDGLGKKSIEKIFANIDEVMETITLEKLMAASHVFGTGIGQRKIKQIIKEIPNILDIQDQEKLKEMVKNIDGFSDITTDKFVDNLDKFKIFYKQLKEIYDLSHIEKVTKEKKKENKDVSFKDMKIVFTGFRDSSLQEKIENAGGKVSTSVSSKTTLVVHADNEKSSSKIDKATELGIEIMNKSEFIKKFSL